MAVKAGRKSCDYLDIEELFKVMTESDLYGWFNNSVVIVPKEVGDVHKRDLSYVSAPLAL